MFSNKNIFSGFQTSEDDLNAGSSSKTPPPRRVSLRLIKTKDEVKIDNIIDKFLAENSDGITSKAQLNPNVKLTRLTPTLKMIYLDDWTFLKGYKGFKIPENKFETFLIKREIAQDDFIVKMKRTDANGKGTDYFIKWKSNKVLNLKDGWYKTEEIGEITQLMIEKNAEMHKNCKKN